jgi:ATP-dependent DNA helicase PIF1
MKNDCLTYLESGKQIPIDILQRCSSLSVMEKESELEHILNNSQCNKIIRLKKGAAVMCTINLDMDLEICNGSQGVVIDIIETNGVIVPVVKFSNGIIKRIEKHYWQSEEYPILAIGQYPLCLAWALTIHKIQGATLSMAEIDIGRSIFEYGQTYVALSRIQSLDGLYLSAFEPNKIRANPTVTDFYKSIKPITYEEIEKDVPEIKTDVKIINQVPGSSFKILKI